MPYKDPERKKEWERLYRSKRLARRRQLRQAEATREEAQPEARQASGRGGMITASCGRWRRPGRLQSQTGYHRRWLHVGSGLSL